MVLAALLAVLLAIPAVATGDSNPYVQPVWFEWGSGNRGLPIDVLIVPPAHGQVVNENGLLGGDEGGASELSPFENSYLQAVEASARAFVPAIAKFGPGWLKHGIVINFYVLGRDDVPSEARSDPEIVILSDETKATILGVSFSSDPCIVDNSTFFASSFTYADMYNVSGHEFGHCMGLDHVEGQGSEIDHDVMHPTYEDNPGASGNHLHCISNLNVMGIERAFAGALGKHTRHGLRPSVKPNQYKRIDC